MRAASGAVTSEGDRELAIGATIAGEGAAPAQPIASAIGAITIA
jgi:hypothetical protein